ncbi:MAG: RdgB/HAM1 family non-canonical purine NTP pyrophosphatase [Propionivibrio sp.]|uniref:RdgB/HAM1 family non-canonical purine NTP pyrophosphatase n=1 Tax=Propionivibrio sp. TaxID=2212460 RepID=UPI0025DE4D65|nr:RdgB/HAM1 family non-canonical purine NTP pyrophosphatase [Propionivibrio sp.]MBK7354729.1 RdgB/HAM1 family non-canonical purine NTP pyrophosphatase [Propionivibrio sp.]MBK8402100.1 RdgB/HAM1 family non-canonical purine NTP pyrophosphatase [Propionivibrio sp.]
MKLVLASNNVKKLKELGQILSPLGWELIPQAQLGVPETDEPHCTFVENALEKARHASRMTGLPALADDSGLCVDALAGAPGVQSARYAQTHANEPKSDARNNMKLLAELGERNDRSARFVAVIVFVRHANDPQPIIAEGEWHGEILTEERGKDGFGYDPLFYIRELGQASAELGAEEKNRRSHRGQALARLVERLQAQR